MKIVLIGPGVTPIPPVDNKAYACEALIWDYHQILNSYDDVECHIINEKRTNAMIEKTNALNPDVVHIMYDDHIVIADKLKSKNILYTTHFAYITQPRIYRGQHYEKNILNPMLRVKDKIHIFAISKEIADFYSVKGVPRERLHVVHNGANTKEFKYTKEPKFKDRSICLGRVEQRKRQYLFQHNTSIDFVGNKVSSPFNTNIPNYVGSWTRQQVYENLTNYANLVHFSDGEADPLVIKEALITGLGIVATSVSAANLDQSKPYIDIITEQQLKDKAYVDKIIEENRKKSLLHRDEIREYALKHFNWEEIIKNKYLKTIYQIFNLEKKQENSDYNQNTFLEYNIKKDINLFNNDFSANCSIDINKPSKKTIVTCFYKFENKAKHKFDKYETWIKNFLGNVETPMIIYTEEKTRDLIEKSRQKYLDNTKIETIPFDDLETNKQYGDVLEKYHLPIDKEKRIHNRELYIVWHAKMELMLKSTLSNPFKSEWFIWTDIGCFRNRNKKVDIDLSLIKNWPNETKLDQLLKDKINMVLVVPPNKKFFELHPNGISKYSIEFQRCISATIFILHISFVEQAYKEFFNTLDKCLEMKPLRFAGKDQDIWAYLYFQKPKLFNMIKPDKVFDEYFYFQKMLL